MREQTTREAHHSLAVHADLSELLVNGSFGMHRTGEAGVVDEDVDFEPRPRLLRKSVAAQRDR